MEGAGEGEGVDGGGKAWFSLAWDLMRPLGGLGSLPGGMATQN